MNRILHWKIKQKTLKWEWPQEIILTIFLRVITKTVFGAWQSSKITFLWCHCFMLVVWMKVYKSATWGYTERSLTFHYNIFNLKSGTFWYIKVYIFWKLNKLHILVQTFSKYLKKSAPKEVTVLSFASSKSSQFQFWFAALLWFEIHTLCLHCVWDFPFSILFCFH